MAKRVERTFWWGAATSAHQVEGNNHNDWSEWEKLGLVKNHEQSGLAAGHYDRYAEDFSLAKDLGHNAHRLSIEWSRIEPRPGFFDQAAIDHYRHVLQALHDRGLEPLVTLHHFTNPIWIRDQGGWTNAKTVDDFGKYVMTVIRELGPLAKFWITINEPTVFTFHGYLSGYWPPAKKNYYLGAKAIRNMVKAHELAYQLIHRFRDDAQVGAANNLVNFAPSRPGNFLDRGLTNFAEYWHNWWWLNQTFATQDFIGLNYYFHHPLRFRAASPLMLFWPMSDNKNPKSDLGWDIHPEGLGQVLDKLKIYQRPVIITENGIADAGDTKRAQFIRDHVHQISLARQRGLDVRGYFYWSLLDNFEWREGFKPRFGLIEVDYHTLKRTVRPSAHTYRQIIETSNL